MVYVHIDVKTDQSEDVKTTRWSDMAQFFPHGSNEFVKPHDSLSPREKNEPRQLFPNHHFWYPTVRFRGCKCMGFPTEIKSMICVKYLIPIFRALFYGSRLQLLPEPSLIAQAWLHNTNCKWLYIANQSYFSKFHISPKNPTTQRLRNWRKFHTFEKSTLKTSLYCFWCAESLGARRITRIANFC